MSQILKLKPESLAIKPHRSCRANGSTVNIEDPCSALDSLASKPLPDFAAKFSLHNLANQRLKPGVRLISFLSCVIHKLHVSHCIFTVALRST